MNLPPKIERPATTVTVADAKAHFAEYVRRVEAGERIVVTRHGKPVVELHAPAEETRPSILGMFAGQIWVADDFDELGPEWDEYLS
jgi:antitoxin (DNA-binding transcriptional repressor) of toxin-antitoxin stability system